MQNAVTDLTRKIDLTDSEGEPMGEELFLYSPKSILVIGSLSEFKTEKGINKQKYRSFETYRRNLENPEIITFDELYERAKYIIAKQE